VERQRALERAEAERDEQDPHRGDPEARRPQRGAVGAEGGPELGPPQHDDGRTGRDGQGEVQEERPGDAVRSTQGRAGDPAHGIGREHAGEPPVLLPGPALQHREGDAEPQAGRAHALDDPAGEPRLEPREEHEREVAGDDEDERRGQDDARTPRGDDPPRERVAGQLPEGE
jgi:hypothetical protein